MGCLRCCPSARVTPEIIPHLGARENPSCTTKTAAFFKQHLPEFLAGALGAGSTSGLMALGLETNTPIIEVDSAFLLTFIGTSITGSSLAFTKDKKSLPIAHFLGSVLATASFFAYFQEESQFILQAAIGALIGSSISIYFGIQLSESDVVEPLNIEEMPEEKTCSRNTTDESV